MWKSQTWELEAQVRALQTEVEQLRGERSVAFGEVDPTFMACEACGCYCAARKASASIVQRPRRKGDGERGGLFASGRE